MSARALLGSLRRMEDEASEGEIELPPPLDSPPPLEEPEHLLCPIAFTLLWDPVMLRSGHTYERSSILRFWEGRPLANPIGGSSGAKLKSAQMIINYGIRAQVDAWLDSQPCDYVPSGWTQRPPPERRSTQDELDALSEAIEASAAREAAEAAAADAAAAALQEEDAAWQLAEAKESAAIAAQEKEAAALDAARREKEAAAAVAVAAQEKEAALEAALWECVLLDEWCGCFSNLRSGVKRVDSGVAHPRHGKAATKGSGPRAGDAVWSRQRSDLDTLHRSRTRWQLN